MTAEDLPQWQAAHAEMVRDAGDGETAHEKFTRQVRAIVRQEEIREAFESGVCPTCWGNPDWGQP